MDRAAANDEWTGLAFRGMLAILFGIAATFWPELTLKTLVYLFGGFIIASGLIGLVVGLSNVYNNSASFLTRILAVLLGVVEIGVGVYLLRHPTVAFKTFILIIGFTFIARGLIELVTGLFEARGAMFKTVFIIGGLLSALVGIFMLFQPVSGGIAFVWVLGIYALITGPLLIALALEMKNTVVDITDKPRKAVR